MNKQAFRHGGFIYLVPEYIGDIVRKEFKESHQLQQGVAKRQGSINWIAIYDRLNPDQKKEIYRFLDAEEGNVLPVEKFIL